MEQNISCAQIHSVHDRCSFAKAYCADEQSALIPYTTAFYCGIPGAPPAAFLILCIWLLFLFAIMANAASDFLAVNLQSIAKIFGISQTLAGVTLFAFGNGSGDLFSTFAAMSSDNGSLAIGELTGAATFISSVVVGSMAIVTPFTVIKLAFVRDVCFLLAAEALLIGCAANGKISLPECCVMIALYLLFVVVVLISESTTDWRRLPVLRQILRQSDHEVSGETPATVESENYYSNQDSEATVNEATPLLGDPDTQFTESPCANLTENNDALPTSTALPDSSTPVTRTRTRPTRAEFVSVVTPAFHQISESSWWKFILGIFFVPSDALLALTVPKVGTDTDDEAAAAQGESHQPLTGGRWPRWLGIIHTFTSPFFIGFNVLANFDNHLTASDFVRLSLISLLISLVSLAALLYFTVAHRRPHYYDFVSMIGFFVSVAWISLAANEIVGVMETLGIVLGISNAILGFTVFAVGNSLNDLFANLAVARAGMPLMSLGACFGGPLFNTLLGVGFGVGYNLLVGDRGGSAEYLVDVPVSLVVSACTILLVLFAILIVVPLNSWRLDERIGWCLIAAWVLGTACNLVLEITVKKST